ncbi:MAG: ABC transporter ATP-binding protein [Dehalococcoidia bacterium]|nr:ABC transporter ATP-binding protein [Dehalococcoidia bacterium]
MFEIKHLDVYYGVAQILKGISMDVRKGELVTVIGANGAGKTTLMMAISGIVKPASGTIEFLGKRIDKLPSHAIVSLGIVQVPQGRLLFPEMTILENLEIGAYRATDAKSKSIRQKLEEVYAHFEILWERRNQMAGTLSGGQQQMLAIGRALMASPKLLLLDEPSSGLAPLMVEEIANILSNLKKTGLTTILVEQNAALALELADRAYVLEMGSIVGSGKTSDLASSELVKRAYLGM